MRFQLFVALLPLLTILTGCWTAVSNAPLQRFEFSNPHMGTLFHITLYASNRVAAESAADAAFRRVAALEEVMSDYQADSELMRLCQQPFGRPVEVSVELFDVLERAQHVAQLTDGAFDPTIGPYVRLWRFARKRKALPLAPELEAAGAAVGYRKLKLDQKARTVTLLAPNMRLDLGGIGKGYAADAVLKVLKGAGCARALVAASGDIAVGDPPPDRKGWKIAITSLDGSTNTPAGTLLLHNAGVSTSGDIEQAIEIDGVRYSHIVSPTTGLGLTERIQVTIVAENATQTDALATAVSVLGAKRGLALINSLRNTAALILAETNGQKQILQSRRFQRLTASDL